MKRIKKKRGKKIKLENRDQMPGQKERLNEDGGMKEWMERDSGGKGVVLSACLSRAPTSSSYDSERHWTGVRNTAHAILLARTEPILEPLLLTPVQMCSDPPQCLELKRL